MEKSAMTVKAEDQKTVATALISLPMAFSDPHFSSKFLQKTLEKVTAAYTTYLEKDVFPAELKRYADTPGSGKRRSYEPLHIYLSFEITADTPLSSCIGELFFYRGERLADYRVFSITADERAGIFLTEKALLTGRKAKKAAAKEDFDGFYLQNGNVVGYRRVPEGLPCRCRRRDVREKFLQRWILGSTDSYVFVSIPQKRISAEKKEKSKKASFGEKKVSRKEKKSGKTT